ncbi:hypothetical protein [Rhodopirellula baltica]|uniref:hypothetical protein n=1 Tax=Rhodopirellula baltica TaxID=265606 RepID=UPI00114760C9|nr:hypothetical protein [Rhodopirellula baltica]
MNQRHQLDAWLEIRTRMFSSMAKRDRDAWDAVVAMFAPFTEADKILIDQDKLPTNERLSDLADLAGVKLGTLKHRLMDFCRFRLDCRTTLEPKITPNDDGTFLISPRRDNSKGEADRKCLRWLSGDDSVEL